MSKFLHDDDNEDDNDNDGAKARAIPQVFSEKSRAKNLSKYHSNVSSVITLGQVYIFHNQQVNSFPMSPAWLSG